MNKEVTTGAAKGDGHFTRQVAGTKKGKEELRYSGEQGTGQTCFSWEELPVNTNQPVTHPPIETSSDTCQNNSQV